jgi:hypothetical protein
MAEWRVVREVGTDEEATLIAGFLGAEGIETRVESRLFHQQPVTLGQMGIVRVLVSEGDLAGARAALARADSAPEPAASDGDL